MLTRRGILGLVNHGGAQGVKRNIYSVIVILCIVFGGSLFSQDADPVELRMEFSPAAVESGMEGEVVLTCTVVEGYHVSDAASELFGVEFDPVSGIVFMAPEYPPGEEDPYGTVYRGRIQVRVPFSVSNDASSGSRSVTARVTIQPCHEASGLCYAPETRSLSSEMTINKGPVDSSGATEKGSIADRLNRALDSGSLAAILIVFLGGILTSFTPCVYPMIPITIAVIGTQASGGRFRGFVLSLFYVLGIAVTFSTLGFLAAKTGALFGAIAQHPVIVILIASIFLLMGLSMLGLFVIQMPSSLASKLQGKKRRGVLGAILTGLLAGLIVSPCISPLLVVILTWVARSGSVFMGIGLLFSYALGLGILFILVGTFSGILKNLPRSGGWMEIIERAFGILLVILALVYLRPLLPAFVQFWVWAVFFMFLGTGLGAFQSLAQEAGRKQKTGKTLGLLAVIVSACLVFFGFIQHFTTNLKPHGNIIQEKKTCRSR